MTMRTVLVLSFAIAAQARGDEAGAEKMPPIAQGEYTVIHAPESEKANAERLEGPLGPRRPRWAGHFPQFKGGSGQVAARDRRRRAVDLRRPMRGRTFRDAGDVATLKGASP